MPPMLAADVHDSLALAPRIDESYSGSPDPCSLADSPAVNASIQLANWLECQINGFFPYPANGPWDTIYHRTFHPSLHATFNSTHYNYTNFLSLYTSFNATLGQTFAPFRHGFLSSLAVPNANGDRGGFVYVIGWEGGWHVASKRELWFSDAVFAVVRDVGAGERRIVEFRESSNIPNSATLPEGNEGGCGFVE
ncbi:hypothetical protein B0J11DRAFT_519234 [Dendryphion nanum]|uniref:Uncharacterized protein n=1 Tax=Dendryphion nanum TaxID=256645 RepID=A0A9P9EE34_9PLEO|nr:hypothetical protein B0J11DRAFT_519234 [Dendryphion nanum]